MSHAIRTDRRRPRGTAVTEFVEDGHGLVTEWDGAALLFSGYHSTYRYSKSNPQAGLMAGLIGAGEHLAAGTPIQQVLDHPVWERQAWDSP